MGDNDVFSTDPPVAGEEIEKEKEPPDEETTAADDAEEEKAVRLMNAKYLLLEAEKSAADDSEDTPKAVDRQKFREELRRAADRFEKFLATRPETEKRFEKRPTARPEDYINLLPAPSPEVVEEVKKFLHTSRLPYEYEEEVSTDSEEEDEEQEDEFLRENSDTEIEDDDTSLASIPDREVQVEITPATPEQANQSTNLREQYLTIGVDPATPIWQRTLLRPVQDVYEDLEYDGPSKTFYWKRKLKAVDNNVPSYQDLQHVKL
ncbi:nucleolin-like [Microplitis demolitor]|uniref:nucleolin-like n=1 Tax=Microplitis demolitor TaxID=69319 RepID=UPI0004CD9807|nr:nucleolin-like [Microplitis demolitor]